MFLQLQELRVSKDESIYSWTKESDKIKSTGKR